MLLFLFWNICVVGQDIKIIPLKNERISSPLKNYYIKTVKDDRVDTTNIGSCRNGILGKKNQMLNLENGARNALTAFIRNNVGQDSAANPVELHIYQLKVEEKNTSGLKAENELTITLAFYNDAGKLIEHTGGGFTQTTGDPTKLIEELIRGTIDTLLHQFDDWWAKNRALYLAQKTKPSIRVEVALEQEDDPDIVSYSPNRPLTLDDFQGKPEESGTTLAVTYSIVFLKYSSARAMNNEIFLDVSVLATFNKTKSWCRREARNEGTLEHEQRHFDISAIKACELADTIRKFTFSVDRFPIELETLQRQIRKELDEMQDQYDSETRHGNNAAVQEKWNKLIKDRLKDAGCFHG
jgi:hypothetical protein